MRVKIECNAPGLTPFRRRALDRLRTWPAHEFLHVKRDWNQSADRLANTALHQQEGTGVTSEVDCDALVVLNQLQELLLPKDEGSVARVAATTRSRTRSRNSAEVLQLDVVQCIRTDRILRVQNEEKWIVALKAYLSGDLEDLDAGEALKMYVADINQKDWDEYAERLTFASTRRTTVSEAKHRSIWSMDETRDLR
ncbi:hypothetical protein L914_19732 [Phytophthora nicotianae]|uniref:RNase H type-1 domain-containing protein n=1 Tax=Phytophthora nicotianae TaxID=4792 RepID=W2MBF2_PHYNI|nr:hypothetical protein L914_19732 [Phytophthora nicotianae]